MEFVIHEWREESWDKSKFYLSSFISLVASGVCCPMMVMELLAKVWYNGFNDGGEYKRNEGMVLQGLGVLPMSPRCDALSNMDGAG